MSIKKYVVHGVLRTKTPLHISTPEQAYWEAATDTVTPGKPAEPNGQFQITLVQRLSFPRVRLNKDGTAWLSSSIPMISANNMIGKLRRNAAAIMEDHFTSRGEQISIGAFNVLQCGAATGSPDKELPKYGDFRSARAHLYLGLFGGGPKLMRRHLRVGNLIPHTEDTWDKGESFDHPFYEAPKYHWNDLSQRVMENRVDDLQRLSVPDRAARVIIDFEETIASRQKDIAAQRSSAQKKEERAAGKEKLSIGTPVCHEFVPPNVEFPFTFTLLGDESKLGFFLSILERTATRDTFGGRVRNGYGQFDLKEVCLSAYDPMTGEELFEPITGLFNNNTISSNSEVVFNAIAAFKENLAKTTVEEFERLLFKPAAASEDADDAEAA